jgi:hypothetical protein
MPSPRPGGEWCGGDGPDRRRRASLRWLAQGATDLPIDRIEKTASDGNQVAV